MSHHGYFSLFSIGLVNGHLPCGLVYVALAGALAMSDWWKGIFYMFLFGLGTLPALFTVAFFGQLAGIKIRNKLTHLTPWIVALQGIIFILPGLELGILYLSPKLPPSIEQTKNSGYH